MMHSETSHAGLSLQELAADLKDVLLSGESPSKETVDKIQQVINTHNLYIQVLSIAIALERLDRIPEYLGLMDEIQENLIEEVPSLTPENAIRSLRVLNSTVQDTYQLVREMTTTQDASSVLISSFLKLVGNVDGDTFNKEALDKKLEHLSEHDKRKLVNAAQEFVLHLRDSAGGGSAESL